HWRRCGVVTKNAGDGGDKHGLAIRAGAKAKKQGMLASRTGEAIPAHALQEQTERNVPPCDAVEKCKPQWALSIGRNSGRLGAVVRLPMSTSMPGAQVIDTARGVEDPRICIPLFDRSGETAIGLRQALDRSGGLCTRYGAGDFGFAAGSRSTAAD